MIDVSVWSEACKLSYSDWVIRVGYSNMSGAMIGVHDSFSPNSQKLMMIHALLIIGHWSRIMKHRAQFQMVCLQLASELISCLVTNLPPSATGFNCFSFSVSWLLPEIDMT